MAGVENYYVRYRGVVTGPFTRERLISDKRIGRIGVIHNISQDRENWTLAKDIDWLFPPSVAPKPETQDSGPEIGLNEAVVSVASSDKKKSRRVTPTLAFTSVFLIALLLGLMVLLAIKYTRRQAAPVVVPENAVAKMPNPLNANRMDTHVCLVVHQIEMEFLGNDGAKAMLTKTRSSGSGFVVTHDGYILTNRHVVAFLDEADHIVPTPDPVTYKNGQLFFRLSKIAVRFNKDQWYPAKVMYVSPSRDVAVIKIDEEFPAPFEIAKHYERGDKVFAYGFPGSSMDIGRQKNELRASEHEKQVAYDMAHVSHANLSDEYPIFDVVLNLTTGIINTDPRESSSLTSGGTYIQTNTDIRHGNSGGPLIDGDGRVVGINTEAYGIGLEVDADKRMHINSDKLGMNVAYDVRDLVPMIVKWVPELRGRLGDNSGN